jgi:polyhydroxybutyrate depolymerase
MREKIDEIRYFKRIIVYLVRDYGVDPQRIFVAGWQNGASMALRLACELSAELAGVASFAGQLGMKVTRREAV